jgi:hypothetical protein
MPVAQRLSAGLRRTSGSLPPRFCKGYPGQLSMRNVNPPASRQSASIRAPEYSALRPVKSRQRAEQRNGGDADRNGQGARAAGECSSAPAANDRKDEMAAPTVSQLVGLICLHAPVSVHAQDRR